jgi:hypothetical protein
MEEIKLLVMFGVAVAAAALIPFLVLAIYRRVEAGLALLAVLVVLQMSLRESMSLSLGINLYPEDLVYALIAGAAALRCAMSRPGVRISGIWLAFGLVLFLSFGIGATRYGTVAGVQFRGYFYAWTAAFYAMTFRFDAAILRRTLSGLVWLAVWVEVAACLQWFSRATGVQILAAYREATNADALRVIGAEEALFLADATILTLCFVELGGAMRRLKVMRFAWIPSLITLQHRSVWLATAAGIAAALGMQRGARRYSPVQAALIACAAAGVLVVAMVSGRGLTQVADAVGESARRGVMLEDTASWRINGWQQMLAKWSAGGIDVLAIGFPFGSDTSRYAKAGGATIKIEVAAHNAFIQTLYNSGILGLGLLLAFAAQLIASLLKLARVEACRLQCQALLALIACQLVFYVAYGIIPMQMFLLGVAYAFVASNAPVTSRSQAQAAGLASAANP